jgi:hypothetical protein
MIPGQMERKVVDLESEGRSLMQPIDKLEKMISGDPFTEVRITCGSSSLRLTRSGDVHLKGSHIEITALQTVEIKAGENLVLKGSQILQN